MTTPIRVVQYGLGPIGLETARAVLAKAGTGHVELTGAIDIDPEKTGRDVGELLGRSEPTGLVVSADAEEMLRAAAPDVVLHTTTSFLGEVRSQLAKCLRAGAHVVSSTEELSFPFDRHPELAAELDAQARAAGVALVGTGVNPGYAMDILALMATGACVEVSSMRVERVVDAGQRRGPLQRKVGAGLSRAAFAEKKETGTFGHIGLRESLLLVADGLGWSLGEIHETLEPVMAEQARQTEHVQVQQDEVAGLHHAIAGWAGGQEVLSLDLKMYVGAKAPRDAVRVEGTPPIDLVVRGGIFGDTATVAALVNTMALIQEARPGLRTMKDLPVSRAFATSLARRHVSGAV